MDWKNFSKRSAVPLIVVAIVVAVPAVRDWLSIHLQTHPWAAVVSLAAISGLVVYLLTRREGTLSNVLSPEMRDATLISIIVSILLIAGWVLTGASTSLASEGLHSAASRIAMLWAAACFMAGFLTGFLFGVPKVEGENSSASSSAAGKNTTRSSSGYAQRPNTNLEQISDWLTKIIVGLGLVELKTVPTHLGNAARWVAESLSIGAPPSAATISFAGSLILYFSILGFLAGYLLTLLFLAGAFGRAGRGAYGGFGDFAKDDASEKILKFWKPSGGDPNPANEQKLLGWIKKNLPAETTINDLIYTKEMENMRKKAVDGLQIS